MRHGNRPHERRRAAPRRELLPLGGQRSGGGRKRGGTHSCRRAAPRRELLPLGGQRSGGSRKRGGTPMNALAIRNWPQTFVRVALLALFAFLIFGPLANLLLWAFAEKWYFPYKLPQEFGLTFWYRVFQPRGNALVSLGTSVWIAALTVVVALA